jgi:hypothetical protein
LFEEAGILLARSAAGAPLTAGSSEWSRLLEYRPALAAGQMSIGGVAEDHHLRLALDALTMFAHWRTPEIEIKRYDVRFFVAVAPEGQEAVHDAAEIADAILKLWTDGELRRTLAERGRANVARFTWERAARHFRAHYRKLGGRGLTDADREMLAARPLI